MKKITSHLYQINLGAVNAFLIEDQGLTLVDTGYKGSDEKIFKAIRKGGKDPEKIKRIILTHSHPDHAGSVASLKSKLQVPVFAHTADAQLVEQGIAGRLPHVISPGLVNKLVFRFFIQNVGNHIQATEVAEKLQDKDEISVAGGIQVIHTPGHSAGHIGLLLKEDGILIAGDICANMMGLGLSTVYENRILGIKSILKAAAYDFDKAVFGHGKPLIKSANKKLQAKFE
jgi:glyoxylase-like metal-dependent hydrolase (beta-lactamase superfamily II)